ncbi:MAG: nadE [Microbacterium sp.]|nr:nadE [Microbacterium sp.]
MASADLLPVLLVGAPLRHGNRLYNCAVVIHRGRVLGVAPKAYLPTYREFYEHRWYARGDDQAGQVIRVAGETVPFGPDLLFDAVDVPGLTLHAEVCEDVWVPIPPSSGAALAGATVLANLSGSPITIGRADDRNLLSQSQSMRCLAAYVYAAAGQGESTNDRRRRRSRPSAAGPHPSGDVRRQSPHDGAHLPHRVVRTGTARDRHRTASRARSLPLRPRRPGSAGAGLLRGFQHPGVGPRPAPPGVRAATSSPTRSPASRRARRPSATPSPSPRPSAPRSRRSTSGPRHPRCSPAWATPSQPVSPCTT